MVLVAYTLGVRCVAMAITVPVALAINATAAPTSAQTSAFWVAWYLYFGWAASEFYDGPRWRSRWRGMLAAAVGHALIFGLLFAVDAAYAN